MPIRTVAEELRELAQSLRWHGPSPSAERFVAVFMDQNNKCNLRCLMCGFSDARVAALEKYDLPRWLFDRIAAEVFPRASYICFSLMTEPFMTRGFADRLWAVPQYGVPFAEVITNASLLTPHDCETIVRTGLSRVIISIDGGTRETFERIRIGARFDAVLRNFVLLKNTRAALGAQLPALRINHVLSELNVDAFDAFLELVLRLGPDEVAVRTISRMSNALLQESTDDAFWSKVRRHRTSLASFCETTGVRDSAFLRDRHTEIDLVTDDGERLICPKPWDTLAIHPNGDVYPCMAWSREPIGNLAQESFEDIWNGPAVNVIRAEFESVRPGVDCLNCRIRRADDDPGDDFFYRKLAKPAPPAEA
jgi:radical SAM protein with 4Fe4S-binding SPASM domain